MVDRSRTETAQNLQTEAIGTVPAAAGLSNIALWTEPLTATPETPACDVVQQMEQSRNSCVVVVQDQKPVGIFTERDLVKLIAQKQSISPQLPIAAIMTCPVLTISCAEVRESWAVFQQMQQHRIRHLPIVGDMGELIGIITTQSLRETIKPTDLLKLRRVAEVMHTGVVCALPDQPLLHLVQQMAQQKVSCVVIVEPNAAGDSVPLGIVTERDMVRLQNQGIDPETTPVRAVMTAPLILMHPQDTLMQVYEQMQQQQIRRMVVRGDRGELAGIITQSSILQAIDPLEAHTLIQMLQQVNSELEHRVAARTLALTMSNARLKTELAERARTEKALQDSEARYRRIVETANEGIWVLDADSKTLFVNPKMAEMLGYEAEEMQGESLFRFLAPQGIAEESTAPQADRPEPIARSQPAAPPIALELRQPGIHKKYDVKLQRKDGSDLWVLLSTTPILDASEQYLGALAMVVDITERHQLDQMKAEFVSIISHELRTPLTSIQGGLGLLQRKVVDPGSEQGELMLQIAARGVERLVRLVNQILDLERLESGKMLLEKQPCRATELIESAIEQMQALANQSGIRLVAQSENCVIAADSDRILQVLVNLISNAIKFSPGNSTICLGATAAAVVSETGSPMVRFFVRDRGRGIPAHQLETIFDRFQQVSSADARGKSGIGLGLSICRRIVQQHGGKIWVESQVGQGSVFYFTVPAGQLSGQERQDSSVLQNR